MIDNPYQPPTINDGGSNIGWTLFKIILFSVCPLTVIISGYHHNHSSSLMMHLELITIMCQTAGFLIGRLR